MKPIFFYEREYYVFSNFSAFSLVWKGGLFMTSEHVYQWEKFKDPAIQEKIEKARSAHDAFKIAQLHKDRTRSNWNKVRVKIMKKILCQKIIQHPYVRKKLGDSGWQPLIEDSWRDDFWGWGSTTEGKNKLGKLWMEIREESRFLYIVSCREQEVGPIYHQKQKNGHVFFKSVNEDIPSFSSNEGWLCLALFCEMILDEPPLVRGIYSVVGNVDALSANTLVDPRYLQTIYEDSWCKLRDEYSGGIRIPKNFIDLRGKKWMLGY